jgi:hypothetical protein
MAIDVVALRKKLITEDGFMPLIADSMIKHAIKLEEAESRPKKERKKTGWNPAMAGTSNKIEASVEITSVCQTCGDVKVETKLVLIKPDGPRTMKIGVSICNACPAFFRSLKKDVLVSLLLLKEHPAIGTHNTPNLTQVRMAKRMTPEEVIVFTTKD